MKRELVEALKLSGAERFAVVIVYQAAGATATLRPEFFETLEEAEAEADEVRTWDEVAFRPFVVDLEDALSDQQKDVVSRRRVYVDFNYIGGEVRPDITLKGSR